MGYTTLQTLPLPIQVRGLISTFLLILVSKHIGRVKCTWHMLFSFPFFPSLYFFFCEVKKNECCLFFFFFTFSIFYSFQRKISWENPFLLFFFLKPHIDQVILLMPELTRVIFLQQFSRGSQVSRGTAWLYYVSLLLELLKPFCPFLGRILSFMQVEPIFA